MKSLYNAQDNQELINRLNSLTPSSPALWGKMNVSQMLSHCQKPLQITFEELTIKRRLIGFMFGKMAKKKLLSDAPFGKNLPTFKEAKIKGDCDFTTEKEKLANYITRMATGGSEAITKKPHPFFGPLTTYEWDQLQYKHLDHHLKQFGV
jgi:hypothetical protein